MRVAYLWKLITCGAFVFSLVLVKFQVLGFDFSWFEKARRLGLAQSNEEFVGSRLCSFTVSLCLQITLNNQTLALFLSLLMSSIILVILHLNLNPLISKS